MITPNQKQYFPKNACKKLLFKTTMAFWKNTSLFVRPFQLYSNHFVNSKQESGLCNFSPSIVFYMKLDILCTIQMYKEEENHLDSAKCKITHIYF